MTRPDIAYAVQVVNQFVSDTHKNQHSTAHHLLRCIKGIVSQGLFYSSASPLSLRGYMDADWAGCPNTRCSTTGSCMLLETSVISLKCKKQPSL